MKLNTLDSIINDLLYTIRGARVTQSERISRRQIENWVHQYRSILLKQDIDKGKLLNPDYVQILTNVELVQVDKDIEKMGIDYYVLRSKYKLPNTIDFNHKYGIIFISTFYGDEIQLVNEPRVSWQKYRRFTGNDKIAYLKDGYLHIHNTKLLSYVDISGIFQNPLDAINFDNINKGLRLIGYEIEYPIPYNMLPILKGMLLERELGIIMRVPSDNKNDASAYVSGNSKGQAKEGGEE